MSTKKYPGSNQNEDLIAFLRMLEKKLDAPVLNGGFDRLFSNVEQIKTDVDKLNAAIFDPEKGLFVRVKSEKVETDHNFEELESKVDNLENQLKTYRKFVIGAALSVVTTGGAAIIKLLWNFFSSHISFH